MSLGLQGREDTKTRINSSDSCSYQGVEPLKDIPLLSIPSVCEAPL